jgi:hypothetical protein
MVEFLLAADQMSGSAIRKWSPALCGGIIYVPVDQMPVTGNAVRKWSPALCGVTGVIISVSVDQMLGIAIDKCSVKSLDAFAAHP